jgi:hypothetical protein
LDLAIAECPVSYITEASLSLLRIYWREQDKIRAIGRGADPERMPARIVDGLVVIAQEVSRAEATMSRRE